jgi:glycosyltransferase involved in cell wall biosynthesis/serine acetyltransferase
MLSNPVAYYRLARWFHLRRIRFLPRIIEKLTVLIFHCRIPCTVEIGEGFEVGYGGLGVVIHHRAKIGRNVFVSNGVTIGGRNQLPGVPNIEDNVFIATGAKVLGDISVGNGAVIGANAVVIRSVPPRCIAVGVPARISRRNINVRDYTGWPKLSLEESSARKATSARQRSLRILHLVNSFAVGGSESQAVELACRQKANGFQVIVGSLSLEGPLRARLNQSGVEVVEFNPKGSFFRPRGIYQVLRLTSFVLGHRFDVVQTHDLYSTLLGVPSSWLARAPVILSCRRDLAHWWWYTPGHRRLLRWVQNLSTLVIANSQAVRNFLIQEDGFDPKRIGVVRNAVDFERFADVSSARGELFPHLRPEDKLIAVVANMNVETKGHMDLIRAAVEVCQDYPETRFLLIGDGPERPRIESMARQLKVSQNILFLGKRNDVPKILTCCDLFTLPSWAEGLSNSVLEAMAAGLPIVATRVGGTPEIISDGVNGLLVPPKDSGALAEAIVKLLSDRTLARALARSAQERARAEFGFERLLADLDRLYSELGRNKIKIQSPPVARSGKVDQADVLRRDLIGIAEESPDSL